MSERYQITAHITAAPRADRADLLAQVLGTIHPAVIVDAAVLRPTLASSVYVAVLNITTANRPEADDTADRIRNALGLPPIDSIRVRRLDR